MRCYYMLECCTYHCKPRVVLLGRLYARWQFQDYIATRAVQIVQPDLIQAGGIWESRKIAAMAESKAIGAQ